MFIAGLFTIAKTSKQPKHPSTDEQRRCGVYMCAFTDGVLLSHKKSELMPFAVTWVGLEIVKLSEVTEKKVSYHIMYGGGGLVANLCPTLATWWTVACQPPLSIGIL